MICSSQNGQSYSGSLHQPSRGHSLQITGKSSKTILGRLSSHFGDSSISSRSSEHHGGLVFPSSQRLQRLEAPSPDFSSCERLLGSVLNRSVCFSPKFLDSEFPQLETRSSGSRHGCFSPTVDNAQPLRVSSFPNDSQMSSEDPKGFIHCDHNYAILASSTLVSRSPSDVHRLSLSSSSVQPTSPQPSRSIPRSNHVRQSPTSSLENLWPSWTVPGLSPTAINFINKAWAPGTSKAYKSAWKQWYSWCLESHSDPSEADISRVANYLGSMASSGKSYRTVNLHRSAISFQHRYIDGKPVAEHVLIRKLLRGIRLSIPPSPKYSCLRDVNIVLNMFSAWPDNDSLTLKTLSAKLTMLLCLVSCKRVSDVKSLDLNNRQFTPNGVFFPLIEVPRLYYPLLNTQHFQTMVNFVWCYV